MGKISKLRCIYLNLMVNLLSCYDCTARKSWLIIEPAFLEIPRLSFDQPFFYRSKSFRKMLPVLEEISICTEFSNGRRKWNRRCFASFLSLTVWKSDNR